MQSQVRGIGEQMQQAPQAVAGVQPEAPGRSAFANVLKQGIDSVNQAQQKATYPAIHGLEASQARAARLVGEALQALAPLGPPAEPLRALARFIVERKA